MHFCGTIKGKKEIKRANKSLVKLIIRTKNEFIVRNSTRLVKLILIKRKISALSFLAIFALK